MLPNNGQNDRFSDSRKSTFVRQLYAKEQGASLSRAPPPSKDLQQTKPSQHYSWRWLHYQGREVRLKGGQQLALQNAPSEQIHVGRRRGPGARQLSADAPQGLFPSFSFNGSSSAMSSTTIGAFHGKDRVPIHVWNKPGVVLDELCETTQTREKRLALQLHVDEPAQLRDKRDTLREELAALEINLAAKKAALPDELDRPELPTWAGHVELMNAGC